MLNINYSNIFSYYIYTVIYQRNEFHELLDYYISLLYLLKTTSAPISPGDFNKANDKISAATATLISFSLQFLITGSISFMFPERPGYCKKTPRIYHFN